jgi:multidrug efflux pump
VLNVKLSRSHDKKSRFYLATEKFFVSMENGYRNILARFIRVRYFAFAIIPACIGATVFIYFNLQSELAPLEDRNQFRLSVSAPEGTSFTYMEDYIDDLVIFLMDSVPEARIVYSLTGGTSSQSGGGVNNGVVRVFLNDPDQRERSQQDVVDMVNRNLPHFSAGKANALQEQTISTNRRANQPVQFVIQNNDFEKLRTVLPKFLNAASDHPVLMGVDADLKFNKPELKVNINRLKATELGISVEDISQTLQLAYSNLRFGYFSKSGKQYQVIGQVDRINRDDPNDLKDLFVRTESGKLISLDNVVTIEESTTPPALYHFNRYKSTTITAGLTTGHTIGDGVKAMQDIADELLDGTFTTSLSGPSRDFSESSSNTLYAFMLAVVLIYLVLAAQFESFIDPFVIIMTIPLALTGAMLALWMFGQTLNIFSQIGMIMLVGLVTKNGILIVEFANQKRMDGLGVREAVIEASRLRLRPILMTSLAMALGSLPLALSLGAASSSRKPLGLVIVGGVIFSLILTLFVIPAIYTYWSRKPATTT